MSSQEIIIKVIGTVITSYSIHYTKLYEDHVILFASEKRHIPEIEKLFQVGLSFF